MATKTLTHFYPCQKRQLSQLPRQNIKNMLFNYVGNSVISSWHFKYLKHVMPRYWIFYKPNLQDNCTWEKHVPLFFYHKQVSIGKDKALKFMACKGMHTTTVISYKPQSRVWQANLKIGIFQSPSCKGNRSFWRTAPYNFYNIFHKGQLRKCIIQYQLPFMQCIIQCPLPSLPTFRWYKKISSTSTSRFGDSGSVGSCGDLIQDQILPHSVTTSLTPGRIKTSIRALQASNPKTNKGKGINPFLILTQGILQLVRAHHHKCS